MLGGAQVENLVRDLCGHFGLSAPASVRAAAQRCHDAGICTLADFQQRVHETHLRGLGFGPEDEQRIVATRRAEAEQKYRTQAGAARDAAAICTEQVGVSQPIKLSVKGIDICASWTDAVVSPANNHSFTQGDGGVSGVLRGACSDVGRAGNFNDVCYQPKTWIADDGQEVTGTVVPETQAGLQATGGRLKCCGVKYVIHAVGPEWTQFTAEQCADPDGEHFRYVETMIRATTTRSLALAASRGCTTIIIPSISGGIFTHGGNRFGDGALPGQQEREQLAARVAVVAASKMWADDATGPGQSSSVREIILVDHPSPNIGRLDLLVQAFSACFAPGWQAPAPQPPPVTAQSPPTYKESLALLAQQQSSAGKVKAQPSEGLPPGLGSAKPTPQGHTERTRRRTRDKTITLTPSIPTQTRSQSQPEPEPETSDGQTAYSTASAGGLIAKVWTKRSTQAWTQAIAKIEQPSGTLQSGLYIYLYDSIFSTTSVPVDSEIDASAATAAADYDQANSVSNLHGCSVEKLIEGWKFEEEVPMMQIRNGPGAARDLKVVFPHHLDGLSGETICDEFISACANLSQGRKWNEDDGFAPPIVSSIAAGFEKLTYDDSLQRRVAEIRKAAKEAAVASTAGWIKVPHSPAMAQMQAEIRAAAAAATKTD